MARDLTITTLTTAAIAEPGDNDPTNCGVNRTCPGVHTIAEDPTGYYVVVKTTGPRSGWVGREIVDEVADFPPGCVSTVPGGYSIGLEPVTDPEILAAFQSRIAVDEHLGRVERVSEGVPV
jgi:hypothetical protein